MNENNIFNLFATVNNAKLWSVEQMLERALSDIHSGSQTANKAVVIFLNDVDQCYHISYLNAGMSNSEVLALCEVTKNIVVRGMNV